jgi:hypothetical protein
MRLWVWPQACIFPLPGSLHQNEGLFDPEFFIRLISILFRDLSGLNIRSPDDEY